MSTCGEVGSDVHALIKELAIRRVQHRSETHSNESHHLAEGTEVAYVFGEDSRLFYSRHFHSARVTISADRGWRLRAPDSPVPPFARAGVYTSASHRGGNRVRATGRSEWGRGGIGVEVGNGDGNGNVNDHGDGDGAGAGAGTGVEVNEGAQDGSGNGAGTGTGVETRSRRTPGGNGDGSEDSSGDGNGDEDNGNEDKIGEGRREAEMRKKPQNSCRRHAGNGGDLLCRKRGNVEKKGLVQ